MTIVVGVTELDRVALLQSLCLPILGKATSTPETVVMSTAQKSRPRRGASAVEFAVVLPIFITFLFGIIEFGRAIMVQQVLINASRECIRTGVVENLSPAEINTVVQNYCTAAGLPPVNVAVSPNPQSVDSGTPIRCVVTIPYGDVSWVAPQWLAGDFQLVGSSTMRKEAIF